MIISHFVENKIKSEIQKKKKTYTLLHVLIEFLLNLSVAILYIYIDKQKMKKKLNEHILTNLLINSYLLYII